MTKTYNEEIEDNCKALLDFQEICKNFEKNMTKFSSQVTRKQLKKWIKNKI